MKKIITILLVAGLCLSMSARENIFQDCYSSNPMVFKTGGDCLGYPDYRDRAAWKEYFGDYADWFIKEGEKYLDYKFEHIPASVYLAFETGGDRSSFNADYKARDAVKALMLAELAEGKGRFMGKLMDGVWYYAEKISWVHPQHAKRKSTRRSLGDPDEEIIGITSSFVGVNVAMAWHFFHKEWDKVDPSISRAVRKSLDTHIINPFLDERLTDSNWWLGFTPGMPIINWCPWINHNCMLVFLLVEEDQKTLEAGLKRSFKSMDNYINYLRSDGGCDEGPGYWTEAAGQVYDYAHTMKLASGGRFDLLSHPRLYRMGKYITDIYVGDGWVVSHGDGWGRIMGHDLRPSFAWRYGRDCGIPELKDLGTAFWRPDPEGDLYNILTTLPLMKTIKSDHDAAIATHGSPEAVHRAFEKSLKDAWYPENEVAVIRRGDWFLWTLGHNNYAGPRNDTHNHDDVGSFVLYLDTMPVFVDMGKSTPTNGTYDKERYTFFHIRSDSHNVPAINGIEQGEGEDRKATEVKCDLTGGNVSMNIQEAYYPEACATFWNRSFHLDNGGFSLTDSFKLTRRIGADKYRFVTRGEVETVKPGVVRIKVYDYAFSKSRTVEFTYPSSLGINVETMPMDDKAFADVWGPELKFITLSGTAKAPLKGKMQFKVKEIK